MKLAARLASVSTGWSSSTPTSDQVPDDTYANRRSAAGTPTTADAVSCDPTATTVVVVGSPVCSATVGRTRPTTSPGSTSGGNRSVGRSSAANSSADQVRVAASSRPVVEALVISVRRSPVSQKASRSGSSRACRALAQRGPRCSAASW